MNPRQCVGDLLRNRIQVALLLPTEDPYVLQACVAELVQCCRHTAYCVVDQFEDTWDHRLTWFALAAGEVQNGEMRLDRVKIIVLASTSQMKQSFQKLHPKHFKATKDSILNKEN